MGIKNLMAKGQSTQAKGMVYTAKPHEKVEPGAAGLNSLQRLD